MDYSNVEDRLECGEILRPFLEIASNEIEQVAKGRYVHHLLFTDNREIAIPFNDLSLHLTTQASDDYMNAIGGSVVW